MVSGEYLRLPLEGDLFWYSSCQFCGMGGRQIPLSSWSRWMERGLNATNPIPQIVGKWELLLSIGLYFGVLAFTW